MTKVPSRIFSIFISLFLVVVLPVLSATGVSSLGRVITDSKYLDYTVDQFGFSFKYPKYRTLTANTSLIYIGYDSEPRIEIGEDFSVKDSWRNFDNVGSADQPIVGMSVSFVDYSKLGEYDYRVSEKDTIESKNKIEKESETYSSLYDYQGYDKSMIDGKDTYVFKNKTSAIYGNSDWYAYEYFMYQSKYEFSIRITFSDTEEGLRQRDFILESIDLPE